MDRDVILRARKRKLDEFLKVDAYEFSHTKFDGAMSEVVTRLVLERGDSAAALVHDTERDVVVLTEQFRIATYEKGPGWMVEIIAGAVGADESPEACIRREVFEELGYEVKDLKPIGRFYVSPGGASERIFLFYAPVTPADLTNPNASGLSSEQEDIARRDVPIAEFLRQVAEGGYEDAKTLIAGHWLSAKSRSK